MQNHQKNLIRNVLLFGIILTLINACSSSFRREVDVQISSIEKPELVLPKTDVLRLDNITWKVITSENSNEFFIEMEEKGQYPVVFAITPEDYQKLSNNLVDIRSHMQQQKSVQNSYERYYKRSSEIIEESNNRVQKLLLDLKNKYSS